MNFIPVLLLALAVLCLCAFLGSGALILFYFVRNFAAKKRRRGKKPLRKDDKIQKPGGTDALITGDLIMIGLAVTAHVAAVFTGQSFSRCTVIFISALGAALLLSAVLFLFYGFAHKGDKANGQRHMVNKAEKPDPAEKILTGLFWILVLAQMIYILWNAGVYTKGDMTVETVASFLYTDGIYRVNPMTGQAYVEGVPSRLMILCLPALYGFFCRLSGLDPESVVTAAVPVWIFVSSYAAFYCVGRSLFPESRKKRSCFLIVVVMLMWAGSSFYSMDGFDLLYCGYRGVTIRNLVLIPYLISLCLRKRWMPVILCILAEACIVWTLYGMGACLLTAAGLFLAERGRNNGRAS